VNAVVLTIGVVFALWAAIIVRCWLFLAVGW
jgi:hypothetical protein